MSFVNIKSSPNLQDIIFKNIQRRKPQRNLKELDKDLSLFMGVHLEAESLLRKPLS